MRKTMDIKIFDIVDWNGFRGRVMEKSKRLDHLNYISMSSCGVVDVYHTELVESVTIPTFAIGDIVKVLPVPSEEKTSYPLGWMIGTTEFVNQQDVAHEVTGIMEETVYGKPSYQLDNDFWFCLYHLEKLSNYKTYDIV